MTELLLFISGFVIIALLPLPGYLYFKYKQYKQEKMNEFN